MALGTPRRVAAAPVVLVLDVHHDLGAGGLGARVVRVGIGDDDVRALGHGAATGRAGHQTAELVVARRAEHDHAVAKVSWACAIVPSGPGTTRCCSKPKARHSQSMAAGASR